MARKCKIAGCKNLAQWSMQPYGPDPEISFTRQGSHYRGFAFVPVCESCRLDIRQGFSSIHAQPMKSVSFIYAGKIHTIHI